MLPLVTRTRRTSFRIRAVDRVLYSGFRFFGLRGSVGLGFRVDRASYSGLRGRLGFEVVGFTGLGGCCIA